MLTPYESNIPRPISPLAGVVANIMNTPKVAELDDKQWRARQQQYAGKRENWNGGRQVSRSARRHWACVSS